MTLIEALAILENNKDAEFETVSPTGKEYKIFHSVFDYENCIAIAGTRTAPRPLRITSQTLSYDWEFIAEQEESFISMIEKADTHDLKIDHRFFVGGTTGFLPADELLFELTNESTVEELDVILSIAKFYSRPKQEGDKDAPFRRPTRV